MIFIYHMLIKDFRLILCYETESELSDIVYLKMAYSLYKEGLELVSLFKF